MMTLGVRRRGVMMASRHPFVGRALALEQMDVEFPVQTEAKLHTQRGGRGFVLGCGRPAQEDWAIAGLCAHLQATNLLLAGLG